MNLDSLYGGWNVSFNILAAIVGFCGPLIVLAIIICLLAIIGMLLTEGIQWAYKRLKN